MYRNVRLGDDGKLDDKRAAAMAAEFNASGAILLSALLPQETGYWNPVVTTGEDGKATITLTVPERSTAWKFLAKGLSTETLAGEATDDLTVKKDLFGEIKLPLAFTDGDKAEIPVTVHNDAVEKGPIEVVLRTTIGGRRVEETKTIDVTAKGLHEVSFKMELKRPERARREPRGTGSAKDVKPHGAEADDNPTDRTDFELIVRAAGHEDVVAAFGAAAALRRAGVRRRQRFEHGRQHGLGRGPRGHAGGVGRACKSSSARPSSGACWTSCWPRRRGASWKSAAWPPGWIRPRAT